MTNKEYDKAIYEVVKDFELKKKAIRLEYVESNAIAKVGDIVNDGPVTILVEETTYSVPFDSYPIIQYSGIKCNEQGKPYKSNEDGVVRQSNIITINGKPVA